MASSSETTPLLWDQGHKNPHDQFCLLAGVPPSDRPNVKGVRIPPKTLYGRATRQYQHAKTSYNLVSTLSNTLLLSQVIIGAALTALGASESSHILITVFGALNTIIAGLVAYLKSRGQPTRARMYRDDLERVVDEIENSEVMWLGISEDVHGYDEIDVDGKVTVRSEVARLMRLYERAVANNMINNPDNYLLASGRDSAGTALRSRSGPSAAPGAAAVAAAGPSAQIIAAQVAPPAAPVVATAPLAASGDTEASPASAPPRPDTDAAPKKAESSKPGAEDSKAAPQPESKSAPKPEPQAAPKVVVDLAPSAPAPAPQEPEEVNGQPIAATITPARSDSPDASPALTDPAPKENHKHKDDKSKADDNK